MTIEDGALVLRIPAGRARAGWAEVAGVSRKLAKTNSYGAIWQR